MGIIYLSNFPQDLDKFAEKEANEIIEELLSGHDISFENLDETSVKIYIEMNKHLFLEE